jgi:hypothetical protein
VIDSLLVTRKIQYYYIELCIEVHRTGKRHFQNISIYHLCHASRFVLYGIIEPRTGRKFIITTLSCFPSLNLRWVNNRLFGLLFSHTHSTAPLSHRLRRYLQHQLILPRLLVIPRFLLPLAQIQPLQVPLPRPVVPS